VKVVLLRVRCRARRVPVQGGAVYGPIRCRVRVSIILEKNFTARSNPYQRAHLDHMTRHAADHAIPTTSYSRNRSSIGR